MSYYVYQCGPKLTETSLLCLLSTRIKGEYYHAQLASCFVLKKKKTFVFFSGVGHQIGTLYLLSLQPLGYSLSPKNPFLLLIQSVLGCSERHEVGENSSLKKM